MYLQVALPVERFITYITEIWTLSTVHKLMCFQHTLKTKGFMTPITGALSLLTTWGLICIQGALFKKKKKSGKILGYAKL
jgi:hypothetical protein